jgi:hypothetical protein
MQVFVNDRSLGDVAAERATVGEVVEALSVHVDPSEIVTAIVLDDEELSAGDDARYARRSAAGIRRLTLNTCSVPVLAARLRDDARGALVAIVQRLERVVGALGEGRMRDANRDLSIALDELRLVLMLDQQTVRLAGGPRLTEEDALTPLAEDLLGAQRRADASTTRTVLAERLLPLLRDWSARAA